MPVTVPEQTTQRSGYFVSSFIFEKKNGCFVDVGCIYEMLALCSGSNCHLKHNQYDFYFCFFFPAQDLPSSQSAELISSDVNAGTDLIVGFLP